MTDSSQGMPDHRVRGGRAAAAVGAIVVLAVTVSACSSSTTSPAPADVAPPIPLTSSSADPGTGSGAWATLALGHLDDPLNTFWQLFSLSNGSSRWTLATPPGVASNGGLALAVAPASVLAGFGPSQALRFSPLAETTDGGRTWAPGLLPGGLAAVPDSLSVSSGGRPVALLQTGDGTVVTSTSTLSAWRPLISGRALARDPAASSCGIERLTAVASGVGAGSGASSGAGSGTAAVGAACLHGGRPGIFESVGPGWEAVGPALPGAPAGPIEVIRLEEIPGGATALVGAGTGHGVELFALRSTDGLRTWTVAGPLALGGGTLTATGSTPSGGFVVTTGGAHGARGASMVDPPATGWVHLAPPPPGTSAVVATPGNGVDALVVRQSVLDVYALRTRTWERTQVLSVPIQYGSSG